MAFTLLYGGLHISVSGGIQQAYLHSHLTLHLSSYPG